MLAAARCGPSPPSRHPLVPPRAAALPETAALGDRLGGPSPPQGPVQPGQPAAGARPQAEWRGQLLGPLRLGGEYLPEGAARRRQDLANAGWGGSGGELRCGAEMADEALFLLLHNEMVAGLYRAAEQGEGVSGAAAALGTARQQAR